MRSAMLTDMGCLLLIHEPIGSRDERGAEAGRAVYDRMLQFTADLQKRGAARSEAADRKPGPAQRAVCRTSATKVSTASV